MDYVESNAVDFMKRADLECSEELTAASPAKDSSRVSFHSL